jgi:hypothetical protein
MRTVLYSRSPDVLWRATTDRVVLRALHGGGLVSLTGSGTTLWQLLGAPIGFEDLVAAMASHYGVGVEVVRDSVATALADLERVHLVVRDETETPGHVEVPEPRSPLQAAQ